MLNGYYVMAILIILVLLRQNNALKKKREAIIHDYKNSMKIGLVNDELYFANHNMKNEILKLQYNIKSHEIELAKQRRINTELVLKYNSIRESMIDFPVQNGIFFMVRYTEADLLMEFSQN